MPLKIVGPRVTSQWMIPDYSYNHNFETRAFGLAKSFARYFGLGLGHLKFPDWAIIRHFNPAGKTKGTGTMQVKTKIFTIHQNIVMSSMYVFSLIPVSKQVFHIHYHRPFWQPDVLDFRFRASYFFLKWSRTFWDEGCASWFPFQT